MGFSSVMFDGSALKLAENIKISRRVADYAHKFDVSVETELGVLAGIEDENTNSDTHLYTNPDIVHDFVQKTRTDSLAVAIGTSHGAYKRKNPSESLRFDILQRIVKNIPNTPLVLHGASSIPQKYISTRSRARRAPEMKKCPGPYALRRKFVNFAFWSPFYGMIKK